MVVAIFNFSFRFATLSSNQPLIRLHFSRVSQSDGLIIICFVDIDECAKNTHKCSANSFGCGDGGWTPVMKMDGNKARHL